MPLIDWDAISRRMTDAAAKRMNLDTDPNYAPFRKFYYWWGYKFTPLLMNISSFIVAYTIFSKVETRWGIERVFLIFVVIYVMNLRFGNGKD